MYDLAIIGGGINGAGIARDAAERGLKVVLLEQNDFGSGTSSWSSRLIHGGLRYLEYAELSLVFESLHERKRLLTNAAHLVTPLQLYIPLYRTARRSKTLVRLGMWAYDLLSMGKKLPRHQMLTRDQILNQVPGLNTADLIGAATYFDAQITFAERLVLENIIAAEEAGAEVRNYTEVTGITIDDGSVKSIQVRQTDGQCDEITARCIVNAGGPWVDSVQQTANRDLPRLMGGTKGSHIVVNAFEGAPEVAFYVEAESDGRPFFIIPWNQQYLIGTTDIRYTGNPADARPEQNEIEYLLSETNRIFPNAGLTRASISYAYAGIRPLPKKKHGPESAISRKHALVQHPLTAKGLISVVGGKLTTFRSLAEECVDLVLNQLGEKQRPGVTRSRPLPGAGDLQAAKQRLQQSKVTPQCIERVLSIYGSRATQLMQQDCRAEDHEYIDAEQSILVAEVRFAFEHEHAQTLIDLSHRRLMLGLRPDSGGSLSAALSLEAAAVCGWTEAERKTQLASLEQYNQRLRDFS